MYGLGRPLPDVQQITLPTPAGIPRPWGQPCNVYLLSGGLPTVVDTGWAGSRDALVAALREAGVDPNGIRRVLLTSGRPESIGNLEVFARAQVYAGSAALALHATQLRAVALGQAVSHLQSHPAAHRAWQNACPTSLVARVVAGLPNEVIATPIADEQATDDEAPMVALHTPGMWDDSVSWMGTRSGLLCPGHLGVLRMEPDVVRLSEVSAQTSRISRQPARAILPACGPAETEHRAYFRSLALSWANLVQNIQFVVRVPRSAADVAYADLGYLPRDVWRFAALVLRYHSVLEELADAGVARREGEGLGATYQIAAGPGRLDPIPAH